MPNHSPIYGIIGNPVKHSLSPFMHNTAFRALGVKAEYKLFPLEENEIDEFFKNLRRPECDIFGLNVTVPYKEKVIEYLDSLNPFAQRAMAVNTIVISKNRSLVGINTDGPGFLAHLAELKFPTEGKRIAILGAGGTTKSILSAICLLPERPESILIYNRTQEKVEALLSDLGQRVDLSECLIAESIDDLNLELADLLINTTSIGLKPDDPVLVSEDMLHSNLLVYDVVYNPMKTTLLKMADRKGARNANGLGMLYYQGVLAFQHWAGCQLDENVKLKMRESLLRQEVL